MNWIYAGIFILILVALIISGQRSINREKRYQASTHASPGVMRADYDPYEGDDWEDRGYFDGR